MKNKAIVILITILVAAGAGGWAQTFSVPNSFSSNTPISASDMNANFTAIVNKINAMQASLSVDRSSDQPTVCIANRNDGSYNPGHISDPNEALRIIGGNSSGTGGALVQFYRPDGVRSGWINQDNKVGGLAYCAASDRRLKDGIVDTRYSLDQLTKIKVRDFVLRSDPAKQLQTGFIAQELYEVYPDAVSKPANEGGTWGVDYGKLSPIIVKSIQDQQKEIDALKRENAKLKARLAAIEEKLGIR